MTSDKRFVLDVDEKIRWALESLLGSEQIVLASGSPRRSEILKLAGVDCRIIVPDVDETLHEGADPRELGHSIAKRKLDSISDTEQLTVSADTLVVLGKRILGKPTSEAEAFQMLRTLSGQRHFVYTALAIRDRNGQLLVDGDTTYVTFRELSDESIRRYVSTGESMDKAGAYGIQGMGELLVEKLEGSLHNVIGFPIELFVCMVKELRK